MSTYLYSAEVYQIQSYIFQTRKLTQVIGASEWVEYICQDFFRELMGDSYKPENKILSAAGKFQYLFESEDSELCAQVVKNTPKLLAELVPDIKFVQSVVEVAKNLESRHIQRSQWLLDQAKNKQGSRVDPHFMMSERTPQTGQAVLLWEKDPLKETNRDLYQKIKNKLPKIDRLQLSKELVAVQKNRLFEKFLKEDVDKLFPVNEGDKQNMPFPNEFQDLLRNPEDWMAVVHIDGNGMGKIIQNATARISESNQEKLKNFLGEFSNTIEEITILATRTAFFEVVYDIYEKEVDQAEKDKKDTSKIKLAFRPVILGGDDTTFVIRGNLALNFTHSYLRNFEKLSRELLGKLADTYKLEDLKNGLTACAGISYIKYNYPFRYGVDLANSLCKHAKNTRKQVKRGRPSSALMFHRVQSSFIEDYSSIVQRELTVTHEGKDCRFDAGPYFLRTVEGYPTLDRLKRELGDFMESDAPKAGVRGWLKELYHDYSASLQLIKRVARNNPEYDSKLKLHQPFPFTRKIPQKNGSKDVKVTHLADLISLSAIHN